nr:HEAT repeat domain-containing protein [Halococcus agarilyticus]
METKHTPESLDDRLDDIETRIEDAETEADLDAVEDDLDDIEADVEAADLPEPDEDEDADDGDEDEEDERTRDEIESRVTELREAIEAQRGPYAEDVVETVESAKTTITETRWTDQGEHETADAVERFLDEAGDVLDEEFAVERSDDASADDEEVATDGGEDRDDAADENADDADDDHGPLVAALDDVIETIEARDLDPDEDEETIAGLVEAAEGLTGDLDDAQEWDDLTVREKLAAEGFYDVLEAENRKDFPPEWNAIKIYEKQNEPEPILRGLEMFGSDFMEEHCMESLKRLGAPAAYDAMEQRAQKRDKLPIAALGKIGDDRALDTLHEYIEGESDPGLQKVTLKALGEIGSEDSTQPVADRLVADNETVRSNAARALGLIGDARAIDPLADVIDEDDSNSVRASAAWALNQIGTESALDAAREHADDRSYLVQTEAEKAEHAMTDDEATETPA